MQILNIDESLKIREKYILNFIDMETEYYKKNIEKLSQHSDGACYDGYLWDCFVKFNIQSEIYCKQYIKNKCNIYILWDIHSCDKIWIKDYWKYPKNAVLKMEHSEYLILSNTLPDDIYIFDESFLWTIAFTHETDVSGNRWCIFAYNKELELNSFRT